MLKLLVIGTALTVGIAATAVDTQISLSHESGTPSAFDSQLTLLHMPGSNVVVTWPGLVKHFAIYLVGSLICREFQQSTSKVKNITNLKKKNIGNVENKPLNHLDENIAKRMQDKLLSYQDRKLAYEMVLSAKRSSPKISEQWYWDKVVYDLNRDRR